MGQKAKKYMQPQIVRHGEVILKPISSIPEKAKLIKKVKSHIVAHSETGHHHVLELKKPTLSIYELDGKTYLELGDIGELVHKKTGTETHTPHIIAPAKYEIIIKQSYDYFKKALTRVRD